jgi:serine/threonine protein kinase
LGTFEGSEDYYEKIDKLKCWAMQDCDHFVEFRTLWVEIYKNEMIESYKQAMKFVEESTNADSEGDSGIESIGDPKAILHIQMDLCLFNLREAMTKVKKEQKILVGKLLDPVGYYIASELLIEILEGIDYLHKKTPPIIHRDLKPENILITTGKNGKFVKISDFGIATFHFNDQLQAQLKRSMMYMAPEVENDKNYNIKADIYSLGVIIQDMFNLKINK